ncbi:hypothetical protein Dsin_023909 [Dipteronia sinensis]|uniref:Uncharacterized protein n=1 Tax=Dipteronia sinensis TaxID=43782 RepID=A0AAE0A4H2_9ROSI|nr:hypothetical protein Dsin_023909 [Dipteronia sinensis]
MASNEPKQGSGGGGFFASVVSSLSNLGSAMTKSVNGVFSGFGEASKGANGYLQPQLVSISQGIALKSSLKMSTLVNAIASERLIRKGMVLNAATMVTIHLELYPWSNNDCDTTSCYCNIEKQPPLCEKHKDGNDSRAINSVIRRAADAITNLAHEHDSIKTCVRMEGGIPPLVELLEFTDTKVQRIVECNAHPTLIPMLRSEDVAIHYEVTTTPLARPAKSG